MEANLWGRALGLIVLLSGSSLLAAPPWSKMFSRTRIEADEDKMYPVSEDNGPWMIVATTFSGDGATEDARKLVHELRSRYKLTAYTYAKRFDFSKGSEGRGVDKYGAPLRMRYQKGDSVQEIAVLVGDFAEAGDTQAQRTLRKIKFAQPDTLKGADGDKPNQTLGHFRAMQREVHQALLPESDDRKFRGPMGHAFVTTNPLLPPEFFNPKGVDKLVLQMNKGVKHGLLDCKAKYTVKVATFTGQVVIDQKKIKEIEDGAKYQSRLAEAAEQAHKLTESLRADGVEAYEFHDRYQSIVTVGGFNSTGTPRADGKIEINPAIFKIMQQYGAETKVVPGQAQPQVGKPKTRDGIAFDLSPTIVEVPKRSLSADYQRTAAN